MKNALLIVLLAAAVTAPGCKKSPPPPPSSAVARVHAVKGTAQVQRGGARSEVTPDLLLERTDRLVVGPASVLLLEVLANHQVVRLDEELELTVSELALLGAPPATASIQQQLDGLLAPEERPVFSNRTAGWVVAQEAARAPVALVEADEKKAETAVFVAAQPTADAPPPKPVAPQPASVAPQPAAAREETKVTPPPEALAVDDESKPQADSGQKRMKTLQVVPGRPSSPVATPAPDAVKQEIQAPPKPKAAARDEGAASEEAVASLADDVLQRCLETHLASFGPAVKARYLGLLGLQYRQKDGALRARLPDGLPMPYCASEWLRTHEGLLAPEATWKTLPVPVK